MFYQHFQCLSDPFDTFVGDKMSKHKPLGIMGRDTLFDAINKRQDDVYRRLYDEFNSLSLVPLNEIKHKCIIGLVIKPLRQQEQASKKISHQKNDMISILSIEKTKK
jgi:hypothetical protein